MELSTWTHFINHIQGKKLSEKSILNLFSTMVGKEDYAGSSVAEIKAYLKTLAGK